MIKTNLTKEIIENIVKFTIFVELTKDMPNLHKLAKEYLNEYIKLKLGDNNGEKEK